MPYTSPMICKVPEKFKAQIKDLSTGSSSEHGSLRSIFDTALLDFLAKKPWKTDKYFAWRIPARSLDGQKEKWVLFNIVAEDSICNKVKTQAWELEISLQTFLYSALIWWYPSTQKVEKVTQQERIVDQEGDLFAAEAKDLLKKKTKRKTEA